MRRRLFETLEKMCNGYGHSVSRRAGFITTSMNAEVSEALVGALVAHAASGETAGRYHKEWPIATLKTPIDRLGYGDEVTGELRKLPRWTG